MRCPASRFITHTLSHMCFLILLAAATFRLDYETHSISANAENLFVTLNQSNAELVNEKVDKYLKGKFRPANVLITNVQICLAFWIIGKSILITPKIYLGKRQPTKKQWASYRCECTGIKLTFYNSRRIVLNNLMNKRVKVNSKV